MLRVEAALVAAIARANVGVRAIESNAEAAGQCARPECRRSCSWGVRHGPLAPAAGQVPPAALRTRRSSKMLQEVPTQYLLFVVPTVRQFMK